MTRKAVEEEMTYPREEEVLNRKNEESLEERRKRKKEMVLQLHLQQ